MVSEKEIDKILRENDKRWEMLRAFYDPVTGHHAPGDRVQIKISDFAIPLQWVPREMLKNKFVKEVLRCGTIKKFLKEHPSDEVIKTEHDVEVTLRRIRHKYDFCFWAYFCWRIKKKGGGMMRFVLNYPQIQVLNACEEMRLAGLPIDIIIVKSRQWGGSTFIESYQAWIAFKHDHNHSFSIAAHVLTSAETIKKMIERAVSYYPAWDIGLPEGTKLKLAPGGQTGHTYVIKDDVGNQVLPFEIHIGSAEKPDSLRGKDISGAHYSEVPLWANTPEKRSEDLVADISGGILVRPLTMQAMESTAKSSDDYFHEVYTLAKEGKSSYRPIFIPWLHVPHDTLAIRDKDAFVKWLIEHKDDERPYGKWRDPGKHYWWLWTLGATLEGINWYRYKRLSFSTYAQMANEAPSNDIEAFQAAGQHVFDIYQVEAMRRLCREPYKVGNLISNDRRDRGVLENIKFVEQTNGNLRIWEMPDDSPVSNRYLVSVDIGGPNPTSDFHSVRVMDRFMMMPEYNGKPNIVADMHYHCTRDDLVYDAIRLAEWYGHALLVIESNTLETNDKERNTEGDGSQYVLDTAAELYTNLYAREAPADQIVEGASTKWGFHTNSRTKPMIIDLMQWAIADQAWDEPSVTCIDEISRYVVDHNKFTAPAKLHDDVLMSTAINLWVCFKEMPLPKWKKENTSSTIKTKTNTIATF